MNKIKKRRLVCFLIALMLLLASFMPNSSRVSADDENVLTAQTETEGTETGDGSENSSEDGEVSDYSLDSFSGADSTDAVGLNVSVDPVIKSNDYVSADYTGKNRSHVSFDKENLYEGETSESLHDHLLFQLEMSPLDGTDKLIAMNIIDAVNDSGYITESLEDILLSVQKDDPEATIEDVKAILKLVQHYDPLGVASRDAAECMLIQLNELDSSTPYRDLAIKVISEYSDLLSNRDFRSLCQKMSIKENVLKEIIAVLKKLNPRPGNFAPSKKTDFVIPDVIVVKKSDGGFFVQDTKISDKFGNDIIWDGIKTLYSRTKDFKAVVQENHGFVIGDFIYYSDEYSLYYKAIAEDNYTINVVGMVTRIIDANNFEYMWSGYFATDIFNSSHGFVQGLPLYLSDKDAGKTVQIQPDISKSLGYPDHKCQARHRKQTETDRNSIAYKRRKEHLFYIEFVIVLLCVGTLPIFVGINGQN